MIDHVQLGLSRITDEYSDQPNFVAFVTATLSQSADIETAGQAILASADIDVAVGAQLDLIGRIVGLNRSIAGALPQPFFGFTDTASGLPFGDEIEGGGGEFYEEGETIGIAYPLPDPLYRMFLKAKILRNSATGTTEDFIAVLRTVFPTDIIVVQDAVGKLQVNLTINRILTFSETAFIGNADILPKPGGVAINVIPYVYSPKYFGFNSTDATYGDDVVGGGGPFNEDAY